MPASLALRSLVTADRTIEVSLQEVQVSDPGPDEVLIRMEAAAINPSDLGFMFAGADLSQASVRDAGGTPTLVAPLPEAAARAAAARVGEPLAVGQEGAGTVIATGSSAAARALLGKVVGITDRGSYGQLRCLPAAACLPFPDGTTARDAAAWRVNPVTALAMVATMRVEGHAALVNAPGAGSLGLILQRLCAADGIPLVSIVRRPEQAVQLRELGAEHVCDSSAADFAEQLEDAIAATGATLAFDQVAGGTLTSEILEAMERSLMRGQPFSRYGSPVHKQVYLAGSLDRQPTSLNRAYGLSWGVGGWYVAARVQQLGDEAWARMKARIAAEIRSTFATAFAKTIGLGDLVELEAARDFARSATNNKHVVDLLDVPAPAGDAARDPRLSTGA